jgi:hypothetical protein
VVQIAAADCYDARMACQSGEGLDATQRQTLHVAGVAGLVFAALYLAHVVLQSPGPADGSVATVTSYFSERRFELLLSEALNGIGLIVFVLFLAGLVGPLRQAGEHVGATAVQVSGTAFVALGLMSTAAETALVRVATIGERAAVLTLFELQSTVPVVFAITAFTGTIALALLRTQLLPRWLGVAGLGASAVFLLGAVLSIFGTAEGESSPVGPALFLAWMLVLCIGLLRANR